MYNAFAKQYPEQLDLTQKADALKNPVAILDSLVGITADNPVSLEEAKKERLARQGE